MSKYYDNISKEIKDYFKILEPNYPEWLNEYIDTKELLSQQYISVTCGTIYSDLFESNFFFSSLDHSVAVALIVWHFTHDKKQTLSGLFHDTATPVFKHCVDFLNGDYMLQESTEDLTTELIKNSKEIMQLPKNVYYVYHGAKVRYIDPLFNGERISKCCKIANKMIENNLDYDINNYVYLDSDF